MLQKNKISTTAEKPAGRKRRERGRVAQEKHAPLVLLAGLVFLTWAVLGGVWLLVTRPRPPQAPVLPAVSVEPPVPVFARLLDGVAVSSSARQSPAVVAVVVDNHHDAQPLSGIDRARVVYEAPAEGGIPRLLALFFADEDVSEVGPVRSARPYFIDFAGEYGAFFIHVGGSPEAQERLKNEARVTNADQYYNGSASWRDSSRFAPHNTYTGHAKWIQALPLYEMATTSVFASWNFSGTVQGGAPQIADEITIPSSHHGYDAVWRFRNGAYERQFGDTPLITRGGEGVFADTVVIQAVRARVLDSQGRLSLETRGAGNAWVLRDGLVFEGTWKYDARLNRTLWSDKNGTSLALKPGRVWVQVIDSRATPEFRNTP